MNRRIWLILICLFSILPSFGQSLPNYVPTSGLMGWWPLDGNANDISGNGYNGTAYGVTSVSDRNGNSNSAYSFDITSTGWGSAKDRIVVTDDAVANAWYQANAFTISTWIKLDVKTGSFANRPHTILGIWDGNGTAVIRHQISPSNLQITTLSSTTAGSTTISNNDWVHVVTSWDGDTLRHYHNGTAAGKSYLSYSIPSSTNYADITFGELHMGNGHWYHFVGSMDDMGVWDRALSPSEVEQLYSAIVPCTETTIAQSDTTICFGDPITLSLDVFDQANYTYLGSSNTSKYYIDNSNVGWTNSRNAALAAGADLVVIEDSNEQNLLYSFISAPAISSLNIDGYHIGYYQDLQSTNFSEPSGGWTWVNGTSTYTNWANNEPSNSGCGTEDWGLMYPNGKWNDQCDVTYPNDDIRGIIEVPIFPTVANLSWSTGSTQSFITVSPTQASTYWIETIENGSVCRDSIHIDINHPQITVTNPATCGNQSDSSLLSLDGFTGQKLTPIDSIEGAISANWSKQIATAPGQDYVLEISGLFTYGTYCPSLVTDPAYGLAGFYGRTSPQPRGISPDVSGLYVLGDTLTRPSPDIYNSTSHTYYYPFTATGNSITVGWYDSGSGDNCGSASFKLSKVNQSTLWSTGQTEDEIWVKPNVSTNYWVAQTLGNTTCTTNASINILPKTIVGGDTTVCEGTELTLSGSGGFSLNGANNYIALEKPGPTGQTQRSFSVWFKTAATEDMSIFGYGSSSCRSNAQLRLNHNANYSAAYNGTTCPYTKGLAAVHGCHNGNFDAIVSDNQWHHVAYVMGENNNYAFNNINLYLDGILVSNSSQGCFHNWGGWQYDTGSDIPITIGKLFNGNGRYFNGELDDFAIFDTAITSMKVQDIYSNGIDLNDSHLSNYFNFENIVGDSIFDLKGDNHGKIYGALNPSASAAPNSGMSYLWSTGDTTSSITFTTHNSAIYWLKTTLNGASCYDTVSVTVLPSKIIASDSLYCSIGDSALLYINSTGLPSAQVNPLPNSLSDGLVAWYPFNGNTDDESGNGHHGTVVGATLSSDRNGNANAAYEFDYNNWSWGSGGDRIFIPHDVSFSSPNITVSIWAKRYSNGYGGNELLRMIGRTQNGYSNPFGEYWALGHRNQAGNYDAYAWITDASQNASTSIMSTPSLNEWHHYAMTWDGSYLRLFIDGLLQDSTASTTGINTSGSSGISIGVSMQANGEWFPYDGALDDVGYWGRALSKSEINYLFTGSNISWSTSQNNDSIYIPLDSSLNYYVVTSQNGTTCSDSITISVNQGIQASDTTICYGENVTLSTVSGQSAIWSTGDTASSITVNPATTTKYWATTSYVGGTCPDTLTVYVNAPSVHGQTHSCNSNDSLLLWTTNTSTSTPNSVLPLCNSITGSLNNGLVAYYPFCGNADDLSNNGNHGVVNGASLTSDRFGKPNSAYIFDGINDFIEIANSTSLSQSNTNGLTLSCWIKNDQVWQNPKWLYVISKTDGTIQNGDGGYILRAGADGGAPFGYVPVFKTINGGNQFSSTNPITDVWEHLCLTYNNDTARFYRDGVLVKEYLSGSAALKANTRDLILGASVSNSNYFKGILDEVGIWDRALSQDEIAQLMNTGTGAVTTQWSTGQTNDSIRVNPNQTTTYWIEQSLNGVTCTDSVTVFINKVNIEPSLPTICTPGDSVLLYAPGVEQQPRFASNQIMNWSNGASNDSIWLTPTQEGDYWLTSSINGESCSDTVSLRILEPSIHASATISCSPGDSVMLYYDGFSNARGLEAVLWSTGETSDTIWVNPTTTSTYSVTASRGGVNCLDSVQIDVTTLSNFDPLIPTRIHCEATNTVLDGTDGSAISYNWSTGAQSSSTTVTTSGQYWVQTTDNLGCSFSDTTQVWLSNIQSNLSSIEPTCYGFSNGFITPNPSGGISNYAYLWSNNDTTAALSATASGLYWVTITDSVGCSIQDSIHLDEPTDLTVTASATSNHNGYNIPCFGGSNGQANAVVIGGTLPYTYSWSNGSPDSIVYSLAAGTHTVNIMDSNGCITSDTVLITQPTGINTSLSSTSSYNGFDISCYGVQDGSIQLAVSGGVTPYQHYWSNGANGTSVSNIGAGLYTVNTVDANGCSSVDSITLNQPNVLTSTATLVSNYNGYNVSCYGAADGSAQISAVGGNAPYTYNWSNGATSNQNNGISAGSYSVTVTDTNGCTVQNSVVLNEPTELQISTSVTSNFNGYPISCTGANDGSALVNSNGGTAPYTILWSNGDTSLTTNNLSAGTYFVTVTDANGCSKSDSVVLSDPIGLSNLTLSASSYNGFNISCHGENDGNISMTGVSGGTAPLSYYWNTGDSTSSITSLPAGNYTLTVTDVNGCSISDSLTLNQPTVLTSNASVTSNFNGTNISCKGATDGSAQVSGAGGVGPYTFLWNTSDTSTTISNLSAGTYTVLVTDANGCFTMDTVSLTEPSLFSITAGVQSNYNGYNISCAGGANGQVAALAIGGTGPYNYTWSNGSSSPGQSNLAAGMYIINVSDANGCSAADTLTLIEPPALSSIASVTSNYNGYNVSCQGANDGIAIVNTLGGVTPYSINWSNGSSGATVSNLSAGVHTVTIQDANGCSTNASVNLTEPGGVSVTATSSPTTCFGADDGSATLTVSGGTGNFDIQWSNGGTGLNQTGLASNWYSYTISTSPNCFLTDSIWVDQPEPLVIQVDTVPPTCISAFDGEINVVAFGGTPGYQYFLNGTAFSGFQDELGTDSLEIVAVDMNNCDTTLILAMPAQTQSCLFIPNWFTPNGNNQEDAWRIEGFEYENLRLKVFNVMGQLIYTTESSIYIPWDGNYNGSPLPGGDYYYLIESTVNDSKYSGYVTLLR